MNEILIALISGLCVAIPSIITSVTANKNNNNLINYRIDKLEQQLIKHNNLIDRTYKLETRVTLLEDEMRDLKK